MMSKVKPLPVALVRFKATVNFAGWPASVAFCVTLSAAVMMGSRGMWFLTTPLEVAAKVAPTVKVKRV